MKTFFNKYSSQSNSFVATAFAVVITGLLIGGYEVSQSVSNPETPAAQGEQAPAVARLETIVVTARRG